MKWLIFLLTVLASAIAAELAPEVTIEQGIVSGITNDDGSVLQYIGIPYGTANSTNRFQAPLPPPKWDGVYNATEEFICIQSVNYQNQLISYGTEDCLKVNVYVPANATKTLPVMVWVPGGGFSADSGGKLNYGPEYLVHKHVILVTLNYRLGLLGFLCLGVEGAPGNAGLKDQVAALRWVKKNIAAFGGDPDNVTLFGESAGGTSVSALVASQATKGLFNRAIIQSGSASSNWGINRYALKSASLFVKGLGNDTNDPQVIYDVISEMSLDELVKAQGSFTPSINNYSDFITLGFPCVEKPIEGVESVLTDLPYNLLKKYPKNIPLIYGTTSREGLYMTPSEEGLLLMNSQYLFGRDLEFNSTEEQEEVNSRLKKFYFNSSEVNISQKENVIDFSTQLYFEMPVLLESDLAVEVSSAPVYNYCFNYTGERNFMKGVVMPNLINETGSAHGDELLYLFNGTILSTPVNVKDGKIINELTTLWTNFAKYGDPSPTKVDAPIKWQPHTRKTTDILYIEDTLRIGSVQHPEAYEMWRDIYKKYRKPDYALVL